MLMYFNHKNRYNTMLCIILYVNKKLCTLAQNYKDKLHSIYFITVYKTANGCYKALETTFEKDFL